ncbi:C40 family peptidase [Bacillus sp. BRMEA1]|uniref:C40 family peptidase n=1 Tax=Neobacillus endophyticus TaxID=2738405 RepID=UPI00156502CD|nr:C40 family peptidase [Neobacillus endophyticus]NRD78104.1 C40 family peptidase [Neobacillus endophyticus]
MGKFSPRILLVPALAGVLMAMPAEMISAKPASAATIQRVPTTSPLVSYAAGLENSKYYQKKLVDSFGFVSYVVKNVYGVQLPRVLRDQEKVGLTVTKSQLQPGDLLFFNTSGKGVSFVGIYKGNNTFIALTTRGIRENSLTNSYWKNRYITAKRITASTDKEAIQLFFANANSNQALADLQITKSLISHFSAHLLMKGVKSVSLIDMSVSGRRGGTVEYTVHYNAVKPKNSIAPVVNGRNQIYMAVEKIDGRYVIMRAGSVPYIQ